MLFRSSGGGRCISWKRRPPRFGLPGQGDGSGLDPKLGRVLTFFGPGRGPLQPKVRDHMPNEPDEEPELPLLHALGIALLLWLVLASLFVAAMYWL